MTHNDDRPLEGRVIPAGQPVRRGPVMLPAHAPRPGDIPPRPSWPDADDEPGEQYTAPPPVTHTCTHLPPDDYAPNATRTRWWAPGGHWKRNLAIAAATVITWPAAPAVWWAHLLNQVQTEQSTGGAWAIAVAVAGIAWCWDRRWQHWDPEVAAWRPALLPRLLLATTLTGAVLALPVFNTLVNTLTGATS